MDRSRNKKAVQQKVSCDIYHLELRLFCCERTKTLNYTEVVGEHLLWRLTMHYASNRIQCVQTDQLVSATHNGHARIKKKNSISRCWTRIAAAALLDRQANNNEKLNWSRLRLFWPKNTNISRFWFAMCAIVIDRAPQICYMATY